MSSVFYDTFIWLLACLRKVSSLIWIFIWLYVIGIAVLIHLGFLVYWPDNFMHEDSQAYMAEAQSILTGHYADDPGRRPYGVAFFLVLLSKLFSPNIVVFVIAQHALSIASAILVAASVRFAGAPRIFSVLAFLLAALYARTVHYDNTVGAETISVFLMCVAMFIATGLAFRNWPPFISAVGIGLSLGPVMVCRSASVGAAAVILLWLLPLMKFGWPRRFGVVLLAGGISLAVYFVPAVINSIVGKHPAANETVAVMSFVVGYSGNFDSGVHLDRKAQARAFVNERRAAYGPTGWADGGEAQWPFQAIAMMGKPDDTEDDLNKFVRDIFLETVTTPSTLWHHLSVNFAREMYFLLFDGSRVAAFASNPQGYRYFVERDRLPFFKSPTGFKYRTLIFDHYHPNWWLLRLLPNPGELQAQIDSLMTLGYMPRTDLADLCCGSDDFKRI